ncbi:MAG: hypothetical protein OXC07_02595, partial [Kistimonas sp.]|nr:hypothetical protein [Kistimonas sp.]
MIRFIRSPLTPGITWQEREATQEPRDFCIVETDVHHPTDQACSGIPAATQHNQREPSLLIGEKHSGVWSLESGVWSLESGVWSLESGVWSLESGVWSLESGVWSLESGV